MIVFLSEQIRIAAALAEHTQPSAQMEQHDMPIDWEKLAQLLAQEAEEGHLPEAVIQKLSANEQQALADLRMPWEKTVELGHKINKVYPEPDVERGKTIIAERIQKDAGKQSKNIQLWQWASLVAASIALLMVYFLGNHAQTSTQKQPVATGIELNDGSKIAISNGTVTKADNFGQETRTVYLNGEATFDVTKNASKPFVVKAALAQVKVLGTTFTFASDTGKNSGNLTVAEGLVAINPKFMPNKWVKIGAAESASFTANQISVAYKAQGSINFSEGKITFDASLAQLARFLADWEGISIEVQPELMDSRVTITQPLGYTNAETLLQMALTAASTTGTVIKKDQGLLLRK